MDQYSDCRNAAGHAIIESDGAEVAELGRCAGPTLAICPTCSASSSPCQAHDGTDPVRPDRQAGGLRPGSEVPGDRSLVRRARRCRWSPTATARPTCSTTSSATCSTPRPASSSGGWTTAAASGAAMPSRRPIVGELGKAALDDQLAGIEYLRTLPYVDDKTHRLRRQVLRRLHDAVRADQRPGGVQGRRGRRAAYHAGSTTTRSTPSATCARPPRTRRATPPPT